MAYSPRALLDIAQRFLQRRDTIRPYALDVPTPTLEEYAESRGAGANPKSVWVDRAILQSHALLERQSVLLNSALAILAERYGREAVSLLHDWAQRQFVDELLSDRWGAWSALFPILLQTDGSMPRRVSLPLASEPWERIDAIARRRFGAARAAADRRRLQEALEIPMSPPEEELERAHPYRQNPELGGLGRAMDAVRRERARRTWDDLDSSLGPPEQSALLRWGRDEAMAQGRYRDLPALHQQMGVVARYPCPCCGFYTFHKWPAGVVGDHANCPVCMWEDDLVGMHDPTAVGSNGVSLEEARENFRRLGAVREEARRFSRPPRDDELPVP